MRVFVKVAIAQSNRLQHVVRLGTHVSIVGFALCRQRLADDVGYGLTGVQRTIRILKHHLKVAPGLAQRGRVQLVQVLPKHTHLPAGWRFQRHDQARQSGFARARLAHHTQAAAGLNGEAHAL